MSSAAPGQLEAPAKEQPEGAEVKSAATRRGGGGAKKRGDRRVAQADEAEARPEDFVHIVPYRKPAANKEGWRPVSLSRSDKAAQLTLSEDRLAVTGAKGYRLVRATHGAHEGTFYCEVTVTHLGETGHCRLGWATAKAELQAPVGADGHGFAYRDLEGSKVTKALREPYGEPYGEGDVIGLLLHMPPGGRRIEQGDAKVVRFKGALWTMQGDEQEPQPLPGSGVAFTKNGTLQGVAFTDMLEGCYYPAASLYTRHAQAEGATVAFNFGPDFRHAPPRVEGWPEPRPVSELAGAPPAEAAGGDAAAAAAAAAAAPAEAGLAAAADPAPMAVG
ncbi:histone methyltransferase complex subunit [Raphidocelis subcapitata]|uniref:Histone methyltransferase complex subunit n=1 Tax=Raphidocelis subcapitata TaxID=307507 RepID=A0A2V0PCX1_9CHLO|nr:histone methyltransferase complex subunit [Raphidocelis subcapitata]|eukprot:GBF97369.1 histone methyltransferase complex subunit [Raphidocelis subcapitata]